MIAANPRSNENDHRIATLPVLVLFPHSRCNCRCVMCDIWRIRQIREITASDLQPHLDSLRALKVRWVVLSGGEPQLHSDLAALSALIRNENIRLTLLTAGLMLKSQALLVTRLVDDVIVSLDGPPAVHDQIRGIPNAFERLASGVAAVRELRSGFPISARCTIQKMNHRLLRETLKTAKKMGLNSISFLAVDVNSRAFNRPDGWADDRQDTVALKASEVEQLGSEVEALIREHAEDLSSGFVAENAEKLHRLPRHFQAHLGQVEPVAPRCNAPWVSAVIEADGSVRPCFFHPTIGNINEAPFQHIVNGERAIRFREGLDVASNPTCRNCVCSLYLDN